DAAFAGEGIVAETFNLSQLEGFYTGGTIHIVINNQIGFTTSPEQSRSSIYSTDVAKITQSPVFHVNGDDPDTVYAILMLALDYRQTFHKDVVIDLICFRRHGHNEADEPTYTHPLLYQRIREHLGVMTLYARKLINEGVIDDATFQNLLKLRIERYEAALLGAKEIVARQNIPSFVEEQPTDAINEEINFERIATGVDSATLTRISQVLTVVPEGFNLNPKLLPLLKRRAEMATGKQPVDWGFAEALAFGSLILEGTAIRISGQDSSRGTFSQRHAIFYDSETGQPWIPLTHLIPNQPRYEIYDSLLSEAGVLGFEYGYSITTPQTLVIWEAQFGDFINAAQVIVDQFISAGEEKWDQASRLVLLLPHGYEGQGPEHSSARLERFLQLCANYNLQVCQCSTPSQYFHLLRRQIHQQASKPLIILTPKSLLRLPAATSSFNELSSANFQPVIEDANSYQGDTVYRTIFCSGKLYYELLRARSSQRVRIVRLEQFYPFPYQELRESINKTPATQEWIWAQEEPQNMGAWTFIEPRLSQLLPTNKRLRFIGRKPATSPATGSATIHQMEQQQIIENALENS
ncbi:MAG: 2-oxoglutarate dehydrogenase E1 component, partial [Acidobacteriota bacterium]